MHAALLHTDLAATDEQRQAGIASTFYRGRISAIYQTVHHLGKGGTFITYEELADILLDNNAPHHSIARSCEALSDNPNLKEVLRRAQDPVTQTLTEMIKKGKTFTSPIPLSAASPASINRVMCALFNNTATADDQRLCAKMVAFAKTHAKVSSPNDRFSSGEILQAQFNTFKGNPDQDPYYLSLIYVLNERKVLNPFSQYDIAPVVPPREFTHARRNSLQSPIELF